MSNSASTPTPSIAPVSPIPPSSSLKHKAAPLVGRCGQKEHQVFLRSLQNFEGAGLAPKIKEAVNAIEEAITRYKGDIAIAFNGGKDVTVIMHLLGAIASMKSIRVNAIFFRDDEKDFEGMFDFVRSLSDEYEFKLHVYGPSMKEGIEDMCKRYNTKAFFLGTRKTDPRGSKQTIFCKSFNGWPDFMLVNPILNWSYSDVWQFLRTFKLRYHPLYDKGYTSLGNRFNTFPNPALRKADGTYMPAYMLKDSMKERNGRK